jgi:HAMP domain-containing protein
MNKLEEKEKEEDNLFSSDSRRLESEKAYKKFEFYIKKNKIFFEERLMESVEEEQLLKEKIEIMVSKEEQINKQISVVQNALNEINLKRFHDNKLKEEIIVKLTNNLESIRTNSAKAKKKILDSSNKKNEGTKMTYKQKNDSLKAEIELLEQQYNEMLQKNTEEELFLRKKTYKVESEVENWIHKYDQEVGERQNELEDLMKRFDEGHKTLSIQKDRYEEVSEEFEKIMIRTEEEKKEKERLERIEFLTRNNNARRIQKVWRIFFTSRGSFKGTNKKSKKEKEKKKKSGKSKSGDKKKKK